MLNYYRILEIPDFSGSAEVRKSFRQLAKMYHPDVTGNAESAELFKLVNTAYTVLSNPDSKIRYDEQLRRALATTAGSTNREAEIESRKAAWKARQHMAERQQYEKNDRIFPYKYRIGVSAMAGLTGLQLVYSHWFVNLNDNSTWYLTLGIFIFLASALFLLNSVYGFYRQKDLNSDRRIPYENISWTVFIGMIVAGPALLLGTNTFRRQYHLRNYGVIERAQIEEVRYSRVTYTFRPEHSEPVKKSSTLQENYIFDMKSRWILIRYSKADPAICQPLSRQY